ncbi:hypothetical protein FGB62_122g039 [Gracilaria domingensis]|nr:hypothetical protein FGB62_122g039 [Gracilaria domingensis]
MINIRSGLHKSGACVAQEGKPSLSPLEHYFAEDKENHPSLRDVMATYHRAARSLLRDANVEENGTIRTINKSGINYTNDNVMDALRLRKERQKKDKDDDNVVERAADVRLLQELTARRPLLRERLKRTRMERRLHRRLQTAAKQSSISFGLLVRPFGS